VVKEDFSAEDIHAEMPQRKSQLCKGPVVELRVTDTAGKDPGAGVRLANWRGGGAGLR
jgi:hypothetical protein